MEQIERQHAFAQPSEIRFFFVPSADGEEAHLRLSVSPRKNIATGRCSFSVSAVLCTTLDLTVSFVLPPFVRKF